MADTPAKVRTLIHIGTPASPGAPVEVRVTLGHAMENGLRPDGYGNVVPRSIVTRFDCWLDDKLVLATDMYPAISANPYISFWLRSDKPGTLRFEWTGDNGFSHRETRPFTAA